MTTHGTPPSPTTGTRQRYSVEEKAELLKEFGQSALSAEAFAREHGIGISTFHYWRRQACRRVTQGKGTHPEGAIGFSEILPSPSSWAGEVSLPDGTQLRWKEGASISVLREMVRGLRRPC